MPRFNTVERLPRFGVMDRQSGEVVALLPFRWQADLLAERSNDNGLWFGLHGAGRELLDGVQVLQPGAGLTKVGQLIAEAGQ